MQVNRIQSNNYNVQPNFKGYVEKELINYVENTSNEVIMNILRKNDYKKKLLNEKTIYLIKKVSLKADEIIEAMKNSVKDLHPQSRLHHYIDYCVDNRNSLNPKHTVQTKFYLYTKYGTARPWELDKKLAKENTAENRFLELIEAVLKKDDSKFTPNNMKELETDTVYNWVNTKLFRNISARKVASEFNLPKDWFKTKKAQIAAEEAKYQEQEIQRRKEYEIAQRKREEERKIRDRIQNQNLETIKDYLK